MQIIFEDAEILIVNKVANLIVNRSGTTNEVTLQDQLAQYLKLPKDDLGIGDRAGIVHRLDRETSGILIVAKTKKAFENLQKQFKERKVQKKYIALVHEKVKDESGVIDSKITRVGKFGKFGVARENRPTFDSNARESVTEYKVERRYSFNEEEFDRFVTRTDLDQGPSLTKSRVRYLKQHAKEYTLLHLFPKTGRTHQIRVHLKSINHPVVSDLIYAPHKLLSFDLLWCPRLFLHAAAIEFAHPRTKKSLKFEADLPDDLQKSMNFLKVKT